MPTGIYLRTEYHRKIISESNRRYPRRFWLGKKFSKEHKEKLSKSLRGYHNSPKTEFRSGPEEGHPRWKGDKVGYYGLHKWVGKHLGKPQKCMFCGKKRFLHWANKSKKYLRNLMDWISLCAKCHHKFDNKSQRMWKTRRRNKKV